MVNAEWVFDCDAPLDQFQRRMREALQRQGWSTGPAQVYDFSAARPGARAFVKLVYHDWGILVAAKVKVGWLAQPERFLRELWAAGREAQVQLTASAPGLPPGKEPYEFHQPR